MRSIEVSSPPGPTRSVVAERGASSEKVCESGGEETAACAFLAAPGM